MTSPHLPGAAMTPLAGHMAIDLPATSSALILDADGGVAVYAANDADRRALVAVAEMLADRTWREEIAMGVPGVPR